MSGVLFRTIIDFFYQVLYMSMIENNLFIDIEIQGKMIKSWKRLLYYICYLK